MQSNRSISKYTLLLMLAGIIVNFIGVKLAVYFELPLFMDSIGTIFTAALCGYLPGIVVGFFSNIINSVADPITMYYSVLSVMIGALAAYLAKRGFFRRPLLALASVPMFSIIGGALGSVMTWVLYGYNFGSGISAPLAISLNALGMEKFWAQFAADMGIDLLDKFIAVAVVFILLRYLPRKLTDKMPLGQLYRPLEEGAEGAAAGRDKFYSRLSLRSKVIALIVFTALILGSLAIVISFLLYKDNMEDRYTQFCESAVNLMLVELDGDKVKEYYENNIETSAYLATERRLGEIRANMAEVQYCYVYRIEPDGCHVIFDVDTPELEGGVLGDVVEFDDAFLPMLPQLLAGEEIDPVITHGAYGWLLTVYKPLLDSAGECVAYAAADIDMGTVVADRYVFVIRILVLLFGASVLLIAFAIWYADRQMVTPINAMSNTARRFAFGSEQERQGSMKRMERLDIHTGDEIENLYLALRYSVAEINTYIMELDEKAEIISRMQENIILSFANMVENRDANTGGHIKRTAAYVDAIGRSLREQGLYKDELTDVYLENLARSAPLHDIGKIKISDVILNKPGKLTDEEFENIKTHTVAGRDILHRALEGIEAESYLSLAMDMATYHHEKWDGSGYPQGLKGEEIPLGARIMAVADVFDALVSQRCYKQPTPFDEAMEIIREGAGTHFDPLVVQAFLAKKEELRQYVQFK